MIKSTFDFLSALFGLLVLSPLFLICSVLIILTSKGSVFYRQVRVGKNNKDFKIFKFRTMHVNADKAGLLTVGGRDARVTMVGFYLRKYKLDEIPQLINVLIGDMSLVGPRPEVRKYVDLYSDRELKVLSVKPGITDLASIKYKNENDILGKQENPEQYYVNVIMKEKLLINLDYISKRSFLSDIRIVFKTFRAIIN